MINFKQEEREEYTIVEFKVDVIEPPELKTLEPPSVNPKKGVVLSGRGPVWLYSYLTHYYHHVAWVATFDPRIGAVVTVSHTKTPRPGDVIELKT
ncbi:MAG: CRISPR-associated ring nuclease Crn3/Csx3 [Candidatus Jordarchaeales archaeon]